MEFKLVISDMVLVKVAGFYKDEKGVQRKFDFELECDRVSQEELKASHEDTTEHAGQFMKRVTKGWRNQRLVLTADDKPADYGPEAMDMLLNISGMGGYCWQSYLRDVLVHEKN